ncbi:hypothetical protein [Aliamphritea spongicola]|nr:hypothetical protein [Aliamphritea spongicola]
MIQLVAQLNKANVIQTDALPDIEQLQRRRQEQVRSKFMQQLKSPLSIRIPMLDPEKFLTATLPLVRFMYTGFGALLWLIIVALGARWRYLTGKR